MNDQADDRIDEIATAIEAYLARFPEARDTARGVRDWWLPPALRGGRLADVEAALWRLVATGRLVAINLPNRSTLFARANGSPGLHRP